jgi:hypothetical protein
MINNRDYKIFTITESMGCAWCYLPLDFQCFADNGSSDPAGADRSALATPW